MSRDVEPGLRHLLGRLALIEARVRRAVAVRRVDDPAPEDPFRGLYLTPDAIARVLDQVRLPLVADEVEEARWRQLEEQADVDESRGEDLRLRRIRRQFGLEPLDVEILLITLAPDVDARFEQLYGYLNDDVTRHRAGVGMTLALCGIPESRSAARARLGAAAPLVAGGLLAVEDPERPFLSRALRIPDRVVEWLLGGDEPDPALVELIEDPPASSCGPDDPLVRALREGTPVTHLREELGGGGTSVAVSAARHAGRSAVVIDLRRMAEQADPVALAGIAVREAGLAAAVLVGGPAEALAAQPAVLRALTRSGIPVVLSGRAHWDPQWADEAPLLLTAAPPSALDHSALWADGLGDRLDPGLNPVAATEQFVLAPEQVVRAARSARLRASSRGAPVDVDDLAHGIRAQNSVGLGRLARRIEPAVGWSDLVLPESTAIQLREIALRARFRSRVLGEWRMRPGGGRGRGVTALFAGDSGTGKSMSAEVVAGELGMELYAVDLSSVVDKYIGETEKNLERIFAEAAGVNGVLLFDEADAIFGKRSEVRDAHDRYANIESAYLLQRMESFDGLAVLATNLRANLDDALTRRLDVVVDFPLPDAALRRTLWDRCLGRLLPRSPDLDLGFCGTAFELSGGNIRSAAVAAAYLAAQEGRPVTTGDLVAGVHREYRKLGRLTLETEFGEYYAALR
jgi:ATPase family associated with various cellular activities (AAA)